MNKDERIKKAFRNKKWPDIKSSDSWNIFKVMAEFVEGYDTLAKMGPCVSIFGSARTKPGHKYYELAENIAKGEGLVVNGTPFVLFPPGYPFIISCFYELTGDISLSCQLITIISFLVSVWLFYRICMLAVGKQRQR